MLSSSVKKINAGMPTFKMEIRLTGETIISFSRHYLYLIYYYGPIYVMTIKLLNINTSLRLMFILNSLLPFLAVQNNFLCSIRNLYPPSRFLQVEITGTSRLLSQKRRFINVFIATNRSTSYCYFIHVFLLSRNQTLHRECVVIITKLAMDYC